MIEMHMPTTTDVLIVGAGPTGLTLAIRLGRYGRLVPHCRHGPHTNGQIEGLARARTDAGIFAAMGIADRADRPWNPGARIRFLRERQAALSRATSRSTSIHRIRSSSPAAKRNGTPPDRAPRRFSASRVERGVTMTAFRQDTSGVTATLPVRGRRKKRVRCRWLVGCDGAHSAVRHGLNMPFAGSTYEHLVLARRCPCALGARRTMRRMPSSASAASSSPSRSPRPIATA